MLYFLSHPPKRFAPSHTTANLTRAQKQRVPACAAALRYQSFERTPLRAHGSSGLWAGSKRGAGVPLCSISRSPLLAALAACPCPAVWGWCQAPPARTSCPHLLPAARQLAGGAETPRSASRGRSLTREGQELLDSVLSADLGWRRGCSGKHKLTTAPGAETLGKLCPFAA